MKPDEPDEENGHGPVIRDRRRIDPATGQVREAERQAGQSQAGPSQPEPGQPRPGRHAVSKPGGGSGNGPGTGPAPGSQQAAGTPESARARQAPGSRGASAGQGGAGQGGTAAAAGQGGTAAAAAGQGGTAAAGAGQGGTAAAGAGQGGTAAAGAGQAAEVEVTAARLAERTADLQRLQAEYANYRKRVERDRIAVREQALANVLTELLPVLDDIGRARQHGELAGGFKSVAESLEAAASKLGLVSYGEDGDPFDPKLHEALMHSYSPDVAEPTCVRILQPGYKVAERILRPARVAVAEPGEPVEPDEPDQHPNASNRGNEGGGDDASSFPDPAGTN